MEVPDAGGCPDASASAGLATSKRRRISTVFLSPMAKLFEEVLHGNVASPSADVFVQFAACTPDGSTSPSPSPAGAGCVSPPSSSCRVALAPGQSRGVSSADTRDPSSQLQGTSSYGRHTGVGHGGTGSSHGSSSAATGPGSPRPSSTHSRGAGLAGSPMRTALQSGSSDMHGHAILRCHMLVLRTQPSLWQALLSSSNAGSGRSPSLDGNEADGPTEVDHRREGALEIIVDDEPEIFLEMIKFVYLNTCHVDHTNMKALMLVADKYGIEEIVKLCLQWIQDNFTASLFYQTLSYRLQRERFQTLLRRSLLYALRSRRHFSLVTEGSAATGGSWEQLPVPFVEALLSSDDLPVVSEAEVLHLLARWANGALANRGRRTRKLGSGSPRSASEDEAGASRRADSPGNVSEASGSASASYAGGGGCNNGEFTEALAPASTEGACYIATAACSGVDDTVNDGGGVAAAGNTSVSISGAGAGAAVSSTPAADRDASSRSSSSNGKPDGDACAEPAPADCVESPSDPDARIQRDMIQLLCTLRKSDMKVPISELEPILRLLNFDQLFSGKVPREFAALDPGFMIYRVVAGVNELNQPNVLQERWKGCQALLGSRDFLQQIDGFKPSSVPDGSIVTFPRLWVRIECSSWSHREKRTSKNSTGQSQGPSMLKTVQSQDDWEIGRKVRSVSSVPNITDNEVIPHKVVCAVVSGHMRHGFTVGQRERTSIYEIEDLSGQQEDACLGGSPTEVEFELQLAVQSPSRCGICRCALSVLPVGPPDGSAEPLLKMVFDASSEEALHVYISSSQFHSNSSYAVALNWVLGPGGDS